MQYTGNPKLAENLQQCKLSSCYWSTCKLAFTITHTQILGLVLMSVWRHPDAQQQKKKPITKNTKRHLPIDRQRTSERSHEPSESTPSRCLHAWKTHPWLDWTTATSTIHTTKSHTTDVMLKHIQFIRVHKMASRISRYVNLKSVLTTRYSKKTTEQLKMFNISVTIDQLSD